MAHLALGDMSRTTEGSAPTRSKALGIALIVLVGLLNFHVPHFVLERADTTGDAANLELVYLANLLGAVVAAMAIWRDRRWGWLLGILVVALSFVLYMAQETIGLPGLPKNWWEPSRIVSLLVEASFILVARHRILSSRERATALPT